MTKRDNKPPKPGEVGYLHWRKESGLEDLLNAIKASGLSDRRFAKEVLGVNERTLRRWKAGETIPQSTKAHITLILAGF